MPAESAVHILTILGSHGVDACVGGGWGIDALLEEQTREHSDLDLWLDAAAIEPLFVALAPMGIDRILPWPGDRPWNFVLHDGGQRRIDLHFYEAASQDELHYGAFSGTEMFPRSALTGRGLIGGMSVRCEQPEWALQWHSGYPLRPVDRQDIGRLCARFALDLPDIYR
jgi:lincosamide nucleotidyltransferase A/C/D/E